LRSLKLGLNMDEEVILNSTEIELVNRFTVLGINISKNFGCSKEHKR